MFCNECGSLSKVKYIDKFEKHLCEKCYKLNEEHPINTLPNIGEVKYDFKGRPICHICGRAYNKLMQHARFKHGLSAIEYKKEFGLNTGKGIISKATAEKLRGYIESNYKEVVEFNLLRYGRNTRFKKGHEGRTKDKLSLEALSELKSRRKR